MASKRDFSSLKSFHSAQPIAKPAMAPSAAAALADRMGRTTQSAEKRGRGRPRKDANAVPAPVGRPRTLSPEARKLTIYLNPELYDAVFEASVAQQRQTRRSVSMNQIVLDWLEHEAKRVGLLKAPAKIEASEPVSPTPPDTPPETRAEEVSEPADITQEPQAAAES